MQARAICKTQTHMACVLRTAVDRERLLNRTNKFLLVMKLSTAFLLMFCLQVSANSKVQAQVTFNGENVPLEKVFKAIQQQTGYMFFYSQDAVKDAMPVTIRVKEKPVEDVLKRCLVGQPLDYTIKNKTIFIIRRSGQEKGTETADDTIPKIQISGRVQLEDSIGISLENVSIYNLSTKQGTTSGVDGYFNILARKGDILEFSFVGIKSRRITVGNKEAPLVVKLQREIKTEELVTVVATGYQDIPKERATGSFSTIDNKTLNQQVSTDVLSRLESIGNSVSVGRKSDFSSGQLRIRGLSTINAPQDPLIILDNFPYYGSLSNLNPNDIESITILKDAAATSIYGARGGNGVIVLTSKNSKFNQKLTIDFSSNVKIIGKTDLFYLGSISTTDAIDVEQFLFANKYRFSDTASNSKPPFSPVYEILFRKQRGEISESEATNLINELRSLDIRNSYRDVFLNNGVNQQYALSVRGGNNNVAFLLSAGFDKNISERSAEFQRVNIRSNTTIQLSKDLRLMSGIFITKANNLNGAPSFSELMARAYPYTQFVDEVGKPLPLYKDYRQTYIDTIGGGKLLDWRYYPAEDYKYAREKNALQDIVANLNINYRLTKYLDLDLKYQYEKQYSDSRTHYDERSYFARDLINRFAKISNSPSVPDSFRVPIGGILDQSVESLVAHQVRGQLNFSYNWSDFRINAIAGAEVSQRHIVGSSNRIYGYDADILTYVNVDYYNTFPVLPNNSRQFIPNNININDRLNRFISLYSNVAFTVSEKYIFSLSGRKDASNIFGAATNNKWNPLWSTGFSWVISEESFFKLSALPLLKFRATYGYSGNVDPSMAAVTTIGYGLTNPFIGTPTAFIEKYYNPDLRWERIRQINIGVDFRIRNGALSGSLEYYSKNGKDLYGPELIDYTVGLNKLFITKNAANMRGQGVDVEITSRNLRGKFSWTTDLNFSYYKDKITKYHLSSNRGSNFIGSGASLTGLEGKPVYSVLSYRWAGLDPETGDPRGYFNKEISKNYSSLTGANTLVTDLVYHGPGLPTVYGSVGNTLEWNNLQLSVRLLYKFGHYFRRSSINYSTLYANGTGHSDFEKRWKEPGDENFTYVPSMVYPTSTSRESFYANSEVLVEKGDHIRLQYITLSYEMTTRRLPKQPLTSLTIFVNANDLGIIWMANKHGLDPDYSSTSIPPSKNIAVGVRASL